MTRGQRSGRATHSKQNVLPEWYPLPVYEKTLSKAEWLEEIVLRMSLRTVMDNEDEGLIDKEPRELHRDRFLSLIVTGESRNRGSLIGGDNENFWPVRSPTVFETYYLAEMHRDPASAQAEEWAKKLATGPMTVHGEFAAGPSKQIRKIKAKDFTDKQMDRLMNIMYRRVPILVDLDQDDETLTLAFKVWLAAVRHTANEKARHSIGEKEFRKWTRYRLLPAFDLLFWARITGMAYTDVFLAHTLWPDNTADKDDFADITERFRKVTRPMVKEVIAWPYTAKLWAQVDLEAALDRVVEKDKRNKPEGKTIPVGTVHALYSGKNSKKAGSRK